MEEVERITMGGVEKEYYTLRFLVNEDLVLRIPVDKVDLLLREPADREELLEILKEVSSSEVDEQKKWNIRIKKNAAKLLSGELRDIAEVWYTLSKKRNNTSLCSSERKMYNESLELLVSEVMNVFSCSYEEAMDILEEYVKG